MIFRTKIPLKSYPKQIDYHSNIFGLGSCFVDNIKEKLDFYQFQNLINPFGVVFNPISLQNITERIVNQAFFTEKDLFKHQGLWKSFELHSSFNHLDKNTYLNQVNQQIEQAHNYLKSAGWFFITLGTAWVYRHKKSQKIVSNCHKVPQTEFDKICLSPTEITNTLHDLIDLIRKFNPNIHFLMSISPVRHLKDGFTENQLSKAHLITALHQLKDPVNYFPSYEIMLDDLRDYRFYKDDFVHPNHLAINYIWDYFKQVLIKPSEINTLKKIEKIQLGLHHKSFNPDLPQEQQRLQKLQKEIEILQKHYPWMQFK